MTHRERFLAVMRYQPVDRVPFRDWGAWPETVERWIKEGYDPDRPPFVVDPTLAWGMGNGVWGMGQVLNHKVPGEMRVGARRRYTPVVAVNRAGMSLCEGIEMVDNRDG